MTLSGGHSARIDAGDVRAARGRYGPGDPGGLPRVEPFGDSALLVTFSEELDLQANRQARHLAARLREWRQVPASDAARPFGEPVAAHASVLVPYDPELVDAAAAVERIAGLAASVPPVLERAGAPEEFEEDLVEIPVVYGGPGGPDLEAVAAHCGLTEDEVVALHSGTTYRVLLLGFAPGFAYLGLLPRELRIPRRASPRPRVPAGSVAIAGRQTAVYPLDTPGGWYLIGRTSLSPWDPRREPPSLLSAGQQVRFRPIAADGA